MIFGGGKSMKTNERVLVLVCLLVAVVYGLLFGWRFLG